MTDALGRHAGTDTAARALDSIHAAQAQLSQIGPSLCQKFIEMWQEGLAEWLRHIISLPRVESVVNAFEHLGLDPGTPYPSSR
jgi:hypothetical protein